MRVLCVFERRMIDLLLASIIGHPLATVECHELSEWMQVVSLLSPLAMINKAKILLEKQKPPAIRRKEHEASAHREKERRKEIAKVYYSSSKCE